MTGKLILLIWAGSLFAQAEVPKTRPLSEYYHLWQDSPFTDKPLVEKTDSVLVNDLDDYVLLGVEVTPNGKLVVVQNIKEEGQRTTIKTWDGGSSGFKILEVQQDPNSSLSTRVLLERGTNKGWVSYDPQYLTLKSAPAPVAAKQNENNQNRRNRGNRGDRRGTQRTEAAAKPRVQYVKPTK